MGQLNYSAKRFSSTGFEVCLMITATEQVVSGNFPLLLFTTSLRGNHYFKEGILVSL